MNDTIKLISYIVVFRRNDLEKMLIDDGVVLDDVSKFTTKELSDATISGLTSSKKFNDDFVNYSKNMDMNNFTGSDDFFNATGFDAWGGDAIKGVTTLFTFNTLNKQHQADLDAQNRANETALALKDKDIEIAKLGLLANQQKLGTASAKSSGNKTLYVALGIGGVAVLGVVIWAVTRK